ncbi:hypothetical protein KL911_000547 [Ogataea haglerorum]|uniref:uncharacterized protein n=1 Tax=Ogataea haglerorum TaxID=1937702 RepID=UPI001C8AE647|nr:uncharacterized protein KL911_000547 [Ogataea haglerorum]KAG7759410.1 hypothetical protein KL911_000547 [Ogataea haglerorum]
MEKKEPTFEFTKKVSQENNGLAEKARKGIKEARSISTWQALWTHRKAVFWTWAISWAIIMEAYDDSLISSVYGYSTFAKKYGRYYPKIKEYQIPARWQTGLSMASPVGEIIGLLINGLLVERYGYKKVIMPCYFLATGFIFIVFFAPNIHVLLAGEILCTIIWGLLGGIAPGYAAEMCPTVLRGYLTMYVNFTFTIGHFIKAGVLCGFSKNTTEWSYRIPFALQWVWPIPLALVTYFAPESPWWLIRRGRPEEAKQTLLKLRNEDESEEVENEVAMMIHSDLRNQNDERNYSYKDCFRGTNLRRTEIVVMVWMAQQMVGFGGVSGSYFFEQVGFTQAKSYSFTFIGEGIALFGDVSSWFFSGIFGHRRLYTGGMYFQSIIYFVVAILALAPQDKDGPKWAAAIILMTQSYFYDCSIGPLAFAITSETPTARLRNKTFAVGRSIYYILGIVQSVANPYMINPTQRNWKGKAAFLPAILSAMWGTWCLFRLPETRARTFEELDVMFENKVPTRSFRTYDTDDALFGDEIEP